MKARVRPRSGARARPLPLRRPRRRLRKVGDAGLGRAGPRGAPGWVLGNRGGVCVCVCHPGAMLGMAYGEGTGEGDGVR